MGERQFQNRNLCAPCLQTSRIGHPLSDSICLLRPADHMGANSAPSVLLLCWRPVHLPLLAAMALSTPRHAMRQRRSCYEALVIRNALATWLSWCWLQVGHGMCNYLLTKPHSLEKFRGMMLIVGRFNATVHLCLVVICECFVARSGLCFDGRLRAWVRAFCDACLTHDCSDAGR